MLAKPADTRKACSRRRGCVSAAVAPKTRCCVFIGVTTLQRDFEGIFRIWQGKSCHRQKYICIYSANAIKNNFAYGSRASPHEKTCPASKENWRIQIQNWRIVLKILGIIDNICPGAYLLLIGEQASGPVQTLVVHQHFGISTERHFCQVHEVQSVLLCVRHLPRVDPCTFDHKSRRTLHFNSRNLVLV